MAVTMAPAAAMDGETEIAVGEHVLTESELEFFEREGGLHQCSIPALLMIMACSIPSCSALRDGSRRRLNLRVWPGFLVVPGCMSAEHSELVKDDIDAQMERRAAEGDTRNSSPWIAETEHLGGLTVFAPIVERVAQLMAANEQGRATFSLHHQHANRFDTGAGSADWHQVRVIRCAARLVPAPRLIQRSLRIQDYEQHPQTDRELLMVHCFYCERSRRLLRPLSALGCFLSGGGALLAHRSERSQRRSRGPDRAAAVAQGRDGPGAGRVWAAVWRR